MGKVSTPHRNSVKVGTKVIKENSVQKTVSRHTQKRILLLRRRLETLLDAKASWESKNQELIENFNKEKKLNAELQKQVFDWQRMYHQAIISLNAHKVKLADVMQNLSTWQKDINQSLLPHIIGLSDNVCRTKAKMTAMMNSLRSFETENYPSAFGNIESAKEKRDKRRKHMVGPMVKGVLIQKPTIRLERVMLEQPQDHEPANNDDLSPTEANGLTPIAEENEQDSSLHLGQISMKRRKHRLGSGERWRMKKQEQLEKERKMERERERENRCSAVAEEDSSDSDNQLGPFIRLQRVSRLLLSPNLLEVDSGRPSESKKSTSRPSESQNSRLRNEADPMEGCSWMNLNTSHSNKSKKSEKAKPPTPTSSDSSGEESDTVVEEIGTIVDRKRVHNQMTDSLYKNQTFSVRRKNSSSSSSADMSRDTSDFSRPEPDSTSNIVFETVRDSLTRDSLARDSLGTNSSNTSVSLRNQLPCSDTTSRVCQPVQVILDNNLPSEVSPPSTTTADSSRSTIQAKKRSNSFCDNCSPLGSPDVQGKRIRKPKIHLYPGEEDSNSKTSSQLKKEKRGTKCISKIPTSRKSCGKSSLKKSLDVSRMSSSATEVERASQGTSNGSWQKKRVPKKSSIKKSLVTPRNSDTASDQRTFLGEGDDEKRGSRRNKKPISYKESPLNVKMRRT